MITEHCPRLHEIQTQLDDITRAFSLEKWFLDFLAIQQFQLHSARAIAQSLSTLTKLKPIPTSLDLNSLVVCKPHDAIPSLVAWHISPWIQQPFSPTTVLRYPIIFAILALAHTSHVPDLLLAFFNHGSNSFKINLNHTISRAIPWSRRGAPRRRWDNCINPIQFAVLSDVYINRHIFGADSPLRAKGYKRSDVADHSIELMIEYYIQSLIDEDVDIVHRPIKTTFG